MYLQRGWKLNWQSTAKPCLKYKIVNSLSGPYNKHNSNLSQWTLKLSSCFRLPAINSQNEGGEPQAEESASVSEPTAAVSGVPYSPIDGDAQVEEAVAAGEATAGVSSVPGELPQTEYRTLSMAFLGAAVSWMIMAGIAGAAAVYNPAPLISNPSAMDRVLLGVLAATCVRMSGALAFLQTCTDARDLHGFRSQTLNISIGLAAAATAVLQIISAPACTPILTGLLVPISAATAALCFAACWRVLLHGGLLILGPDPLLYPRKWLKYVVSLVVMHLTSIRSLTYIALGIAAAAGVNDLINNIPIAGVYSASEVHLRSLAGVNLVVLAAICAASLDYAAAFRRVGPPDAMKEIMIRRMLETHPMMRLATPALTRYRPINAALLASFAISATSLWLAPELGVNLNWDSALWAPQCWTTLLSAPWLVVALFNLSWLEFVSVAAKAMRYSIELVYMVLTTFVHKWEWGIDKRP